MLGPERSGGTLEPDCAVSPMCRCLAPDRGLEHIFFSGLTPGALSPMENVLNGVRESSVQEQTFKDDQLSWFSWD